MMENSKAKILAIMIAVISITSISSCRVRNHQSTTLKGYDTLSGYYTTGLQNITATVKLKNEPTHRSKSLPVSLAVSTYLSILDDPTLLYFDNPVKNYGTLRNHTDPTIGIPITVDASTNSLSYSSEAKGNIDDCTLIGSETRIGSFETTSPQTKNNFNVRGRLNLLLQMGYRFQSDRTDGCDEPLLNFFEKCFNDSETCTENEGDLVHSIFDRYINGDLLKNNEIHKVESVSIEMKYE